MLNEGVFKAVLRLLNKGTSQTQTRALEMIQFFNTQYQPNMISAGVLTQLVGLLKMDGNPDKRLLMAKSLSVIANFTSSFSNASFSFAWHPLHNTLFAQL
jgi:hypothetical protein